MTGIEVLDMINNKIYPTVRCNKDILDVAEQMEEGMLCKIVGAYENSDGEIQVELDEKDFSEYNKSLETPSCYDSESNIYNKKWSELYQREIRMTIFLDKEHDNPYFDIVEDNYTELVKEYNDSESGLTYVEWLQEQIFMLRAMM